MSISKLVAGLNDAKSDLTAREIADVVWLWVQIEESQKLDNLPKNLAEDISTDSSLTKSKTSITGQKTDSSSSPTVNQSSTVVSQVDLYPKIVEKYIPPQKKEQDRPAPLQVPDAPAIPNKRQIEKSLKSLIRKFPSAKERELDVEKTVTRIIEKDIWTPIETPVLTRRWLDLVLVIEVNNSLVIWQQTIKELRQILKRLGIFRRFDIWGLQIELPLNNFALEWFLLKTSAKKLKGKISKKSSNVLLGRWLLAILSHQNEGIQLFRYDDPQMRPYPPEAINAQPGRETLILLVSDLVSPAWNCPEIYILLQQWSSQGMVSLLQLLPERLWLRTVLGKQDRATLNSPARLSHNRKLITLSSFKDQIISQDQSELQNKSEIFTENEDIKTPESKSVTSVEVYYPKETKNLLKPSIKIPVTSLEPYHLEHWSKLLMGKGGNQSVGYKIQPSKKSSLNITHREISPEERLKRFQTIASPTSLRLAKLLSAVLVTLPVIRVIQYTTLPQANQSHVAEVLMGGLFKPLEERVTPFSEPDEIEFQFFPGVREELLSSLTDDEITFAIEQVSAYFAYKMGKTLQEFEALLMSSTYLNDELAKQIRPLAKVQAKVLRQLGGEYAELAKQIPFAEFDLKTFSFETATFIESTETELELTFVIATIEIQETRDFEFSVATLERRREIFGLGNSWQINKEQKQGTEIIEVLEADVDLELIEIPGGNFIMGAPKGKLEGRDRERPLHEVNISTFLMGRYPMTQAQWKVVAGWEQVERELKSDDPSGFIEDYEGISRWTRPVENISWLDAKEFCARLSKKTGKEYRLPTEAEWEYACRAGTTTPFHFGETISIELANYNGNYTYGEGVKGEYRKQTTPVGYFKVANNFGLSDMHGLVWEWCEDDWHENYEGAPTDGSAWISRENSTKILCGGSWNNDPGNCRSAIRYYYSRKYHNFNIGFRVVCVASRTT